MNKVTTLYTLFLLWLLSLPSIYAQDIQRVRIDFKNPEGYIRHLLLGFTPDNSASDNMDYGYDALCIDELDNDLNWMINDQRFVIQGVGEFHEDKSYNFGLFMANSGNVEISLNSLENFDSPINVYIYDNLFNTFYHINDISFSQNVNAGEYLNRFFITFQNLTPPEPSNQLSIDNHYINSIVIKNLLNRKELLIDTKTNLKIDNIEVLDILGKKVVNLKNINATNIRIPTQHINSRIIIISVFTNKGIIRKKLLL